MRNINMTSHGIANFLSEGAWVSSVSSRGRDYVKDGHSVGLLVSGERPTLLLWSLQIAMEASKNGLMEDHGGRTNLVSQHSGCIR